MRTSYSALATYKTCPRKYKYQEIDKIRVPKRIEAVFGTLVHGALKFMFTRNPLYPTLDETINFFSEKWSEKSDAIEWQNPGKRDATEKMYYEEGIRILKNFYKKNQPWTFDVMELEGRFSLDLTDETSGKVHTFAGIIDRIDKDPESGEYEIIDYKTSKRMPSAKALSEDLQLGLYHLALTVRWPHLDPDRIKTSLYFLRHGEKLSAVPTKETRERLTRSILGSVQEIENRTASGDFSPLPGPQCGFCGYRSICPMWSHEYKKAEERKIPTEEELAGAVKEFFELKDEDDARKKRLVELRSVILAYMEKEKVARVFGEPGYITKGVQERLSYDLSSIRPILENIGMWDAVLEPDEKKLEKLLPQIPENVKEEILKFHSKKTAFTLKPTRKK